MYQPQFVTNGLNGLPVMRFDGANDSFALPNVLNGATQAEAFIVLKATNDLPSSPHGLWYFGTSQGYYPNTDGKVLDDFGTGSQRDLGDPAQPVSQFHLYNVSSKANSWNAWINGLNLLSSTNNSFAYTPSPVLGYSITCPYYCYTYYFAGDIAEVLVYNRVLSSDERAAVGTYLNKRFAFVINPPPSPTNLVVQSLSLTAVALSWSADSLNVESFLLERKAGTNSVFTLLAELQGNVKSYSDVGLDQTLPYSYRVKAKYYFVGESGYSNVARYNDQDGDGLADPLETHLGTDPTRSDTDGDGVADGQDAFPLDPTRSVLPSSDPNDHTAPTITLDEPLNATLLP
jgi:hypothetical protein